MLCSAKEPRTGCDASADSARELASGALAREQDERAREKQQADDAVLENRCTLA